MSVTFNLIVFIFHGFDGRIAIEEALIGRLPTEEAENASFEGVNGIINTVLEIEFMLISYVDAFTDYISIDVMYQNGLYTYMYPAIVGLIFQMLCEFAGAVETSTKVVEKSKSGAKKAPSLDEIEGRGITQILTPLLIVLRLKIAYEGFLVITNKRKTKPYLSYKIVDAIFRTYTQNVIQLIVFFSTYNVSSPDSSLTTLILAISISFALLNLAQTVVTNMVPWLSTLSVTYWKLFAFFSCEVTLRFLTIAIVCMTLGPIPAAIAISVDVIVRVIFIEVMEEKRVLKGFTFIHHIRPVFLKLLLQSVTDYTPESVLCMCVSDIDEFEGEILELAKKRGTIDVFKAEVYKCLWSMAGGGFALYLYIHTNSTVLQTIADQGPTVERIMIASLAAKAMVLGYTVVPFDNKSAYSYLMMFAVIGTILSQTYQAILAFVMSFTLVGWMLTAVFPALLVVSLMLPERLFEPVEDFPDRLSQLSVAYFTSALIIYIESLTLYLNWESIGNLSTSQQQWLVEFPVGMITLAAVAAIGGCTYNRYYGVGFINYTASFTAFVSAVFFLIFLIVAYWSPIAAFLVSYWFLYAFFLLAGNTAIFNMIPNSANDRMFRTLGIAAYAIFFNLYWFHLH